MVCFRRFFSSNSAASCLSSLRRCIDSSPSAIPTVTRLSSGCKQCLAHQSLNGALVITVKSTLSNVKVKSVLCTKKLSELSKHWHQQFLNISIFTSTIICHKIIPCTHHVQQTATDLVSLSTTCTVHQSETVLFTRTAEIPSYRRNWTGYVSNSSYVATYNLKRARSEMTRSISKSKWINTAVTA